MSLFLHRSGILAPPSGGGGGSPPVWQARVGGAVSGLTYGVSYDATVQAGDFLAVLIVTQNTALTVTGGGWTKVENTGNGGVRGVLLYKIATANGPQFSDGTISSSSAFLYRVHRFTGVNASAPVNVTASQEVTPASSTGTCPSVTTTVDNCLVVNFIANDGYGSGTGLYFDTWTNANYSSGAEIDDFSAGSQGAPGAYAGVLDSAGASGVTTANQPFGARVQSNITFALAPV